MTHVVNCAEAAADFLHDRIVARRKRSRDMLVSTRFGVPVDFAGSTQRSKEAVVVKGGLR